MELKKLRHEKFVIGSRGISVVGMPNSSTSGGKDTDRDWGCVESPEESGCAGSSRRRLTIGGGAHSSSSERSSWWFGEPSSPEESDCKPILEWLRQ
jgi:hypothetical protein